MDRTPKALIVYPPVYDFALYDLYFKPLALYNLKEIFEKAGWQVFLFNYLNYKDKKSEDALGKVLRKDNGQGKFFRQENYKFSSKNINFAKERLQRGFFRYGILEDVAEDFFSKISPDIIIISTGMTYWYYGVIEAVETLKKMYPKIPIVSGGIYSTLMEDHCLNICKVDKIFSGDSTLKLMNFANSVADGNGKKIVNFKKINIENIYPHEDNFKDDSAILRLNYGCPYSCEYCASNILCSRFKVGDPEKNFDHFFKIYKKGIRNFAFYDDALLIDSDKSFVPFIRKVIEKCPDTAFWTPNAVHINSITEEIANLMKLAGFKEIRLGFESADEEFHNNLDFKYKQSEFEKAIDILKKNGWKKEEIKVYILAGLPNQKSADVFYSLDYAKKFDISASIAEYSPVPKTKLWEQAVKFSKFDITNEPLFQNNTFFPMEWEEFSLKDLFLLKQLSRL